MLEKAERNLLPLINNLLEWDLPDGETASVAAVGFGITSVLGLTARATERPIAKVLKLLRDMSKQLDKERQDDEKVYDHLYCKAKDKVTPMRRIVWKPRGL